VTELAGTWFDGRDSRARAVTLSRPTEFCLRVTGDEGSSIEIPIAAVLISPRLGSTPRILRLPDHGHVECTDSPVLDDWFVAPSRVEAVADWLERRRGPALTAAVLTVVGVIFFFQVGLPWAAERLAPRIPARVEKIMSTQVLELIDRLELKPSRLPAARQQQLRVEFAGLIEDLPRERDMHLEFRHAPGLGANAFALPDGTVVMTDELVALAKSDDELIAVFAHEIGHHEYRHALRQTIESSGVVVVAALLFGDVSGSSLTISMPTVLLETGFSRAHEREADEFAFALLLRKGRSPKAFADMLRRLGKKSKGDNAVIGYFSTHPADEERIRRAEEAAKSR
jgi:Zn-dependent protease with chaperone function